MNLRGQCEQVGLAGILHTHGPSRRLGRAEINPGIGGSVSAVLVEDQGFGLEVDGILEFLGSSLIGAGLTRRIGLQIDLDFTVSRDVARFLVVGEVVAINLVEAGGIAAVENNADVVQFGATVDLELLEAASLDGEQSSLAVGLGELKARRGLLDVDANLVGKLLQ